MDDREQQANDLARRARTRVARLRETHNRFAEHALGPLPRTLDTCGDGRITRDAR